MPMRASSTELIATMVAWMPSPHIVLTQFVGSPEQNELSYSGEVTAVAFA